MTALAEADVEAVLDCLRGGWLTMGPRTRTLEVELARRAGVAEAVAVSSHAGGLALALRVCGVSAGDEVVVPGFGGFAAAAAVRRLGGEPVVAGGDLDADAVRALCGERCSAVVVAHLLDEPADVTGLREVCDGLEVALVEDAGAALGLPLGDGRWAGSAGRVGCVSLAGSGSLGLATGAALLTDDAEPAERLRAMRSHGITASTWDRHRGHADGYDVLEVGFNERLDEPRAALALSRLGGHEERLVARRAAVDAWREAVGGRPAFALLGSGGVGIVCGDRDVRDRLVSSLCAAGVEVVAGEELFAAPTALAERLCVVEPTSDRGAEFTAALERAAGPAQ
jgi:perosamine synthetase